MAVANGTPTSAPAPTGPGMYPGVAQAVSNAAAAALNKSTGTKIVKKTVVPPKTPAGLPTTPLAQAQAQAASETAGAIAPIQGQITQDQTQGTQQQQALNSEFSSLLPWAQQSAQQEGQFNQGMSSDVNAIFQQAGQQMNSLQQNQAAQAQRLAQQTGGPVSTGTFTSASDPYATALAESGAVGRLTTDEIGTNATDAAQAFAGQVLPAMKALQSSQLQNLENANIQKLRDQITTLQGNQSKLVDAKLPALQASQRTWELQLADMRLRRATAQHAWDATTRALDQKQQEIADAEYNQRFNQGATTAKLAMTQQQITDAENHMTTQEKLAARQLNLTAQEYVLRANEFNTTAGLEKQRINVQMEANARSLIDAALGGTSANKPVTETVRQNLTLDNPLVKEALNYQGGLLSKGHAPTNIYHDPKTNQWYTYVKQTMTPAQWSQLTGGSGSSISDPNALYRLLIESKTVSPKVAADLIRTRLQIPSWSPGQSAIPTAQNMARMPLSDLASLAVERGFKGSLVSATRQQFIDYLHASEHGNK